MNIFAIYILGSCIAGFVFTICTQNIDSFYNYLLNLIDNAKNDLKTDKNLSESEYTLLNNINNDNIITQMTVIITILSWIGVIIDIMYILIWLFSVPKQ